VRGFIENIECKDLVSQLMGGNIPNGDINHVVDNKMDVNRDGKVTWEEFLNFFYKANCQTEEENEKDY